MAIRETPILDDCDCEDDEQPGQLLDGKVQMDEDFCSQGTRSMDSLGKGGCDTNHKHSLDNRGELQMLVFGFIYQSVVDLLKASMSEVLGGFLKHQRITSQLTHSSSSLI